MEFRIWVSLTLAVSFLVLAGSGVLLFFIPYNRSFNTIHIVFGLLFMIAALPHLFNNFKSLFSYFIHRKRK